MGKCTVRFLGLVVVLVCVAGNVFAEVKLSGGPYLRVRHEYWRNDFDMNKDALDNRNFFRIKESLWGKAEFNEDLSFYAKLTNESKAYMYYAPSSSKVSGKTDKAMHYDINEVVFDNIYLDSKNIAGLPVDMRFGRQDLSDYGEGFIFSDGTPQDGSRTFYFNALKLVLRPNKENTVDFLYINNPRDDIFLPVINEDKSPTNLNTTNEEAYAVYVRNKSIKNLGLDGYYIYKREDDDGGRGLQTSKGIINTFGTFAKYDLSPYTFRAQAAYQFGSYGDNDRRGFGGYAFVDRDMKDVLWSPKASLGYIAMTGDNRKTTKVEGWDPLFSRAPYISDLAGMSFLNETGINYYWTNIGVLRTSLVLKPTAKTKLTLAYNFMRAYDTVPASTSASMLFGEGKTRGHLPQMKLEYAFNKVTSMYVLGEYFIPGSFYSRRDPAIFLRSELQLKF